VTLALSDVGSRGQNGHRDRLRPGPSVTQCGHLAALCAALDIPRTIASDEAMVASVLSSRTVICIT